MILLYTQTILLCANFGCILFKLKGTICKILTFRQGYRLILTHRLFFKATLSFEHMNTNTHNHVFCRSAI